MDGHYSVKQTAEILKCSTKTVRSKIVNKTLPAVWEDRGKGMSQWWIPMEAVNIATSTIDVIPVTRQLTPLELTETLKSAIREEIAPLKDEISQLRGELESHFRRTDERLREAIKPSPEPNQEPKSFWARFFKR